jgi:hemoglobin-like flavoprotein
MLVAVVDHLEDASWFASNLEALGARHRDYGVTEEMFGWVGECFLATLSKVSGPDWNPDVEAAWIAVYGEITKAMLRGAAQA